MNKTIITAMLLTLVILAGTASALTISSVNVQDTEPGKESLVTINLENNLKSDITDVSININFGNSKFIAVGSSESSLDKIKKDDSESLTYTIKSSSDITPGDYNTPFTIKYTYNNSVIQRDGSFGITVKANAELEYSITTENPVVGSKGKITLQIVNRGLGEAKFLTVKVFPSGYVLTSEESVYLGSVGSDDYQTANYEVIFSGQNALLSATIQYKDFDNNQITKTINMPVRTYSEAEALELGIITKSNTGMYITIVVVLVILWIVWRNIKKRRRIKKSMNNNGR